MTPPAQTDAIERMAPSPRDGFEGRIALITGASRGIGRRLAVSLAARGATPIINYRRNAEAAGEVAAEVEALGVSAFAIQADIESLEELEAMFDEVKERCQFLKILGSYPAA